MELAPLPLVIAANVAVGKSYAKTAIWIVGGVAAWGIAASGLIDLISVLASTNVSQDKFAIDAGSIVSGVAAGGFLLRPIRRDIAMFLPIDPDNPVHALALVLAVILFGTQLTSLVFTDVLSALDRQPPQTILDTFLDELPLALLALAGVGLFVRRKAADAAGRLGLIRPAWWHLALAPAAAGMFLALLTGFDSANHAFFPGLAKHIDSTDSHLFSQLANSNAAGIAALALLPGICEDLLFRGALQPRIGLVPAALLFTSIHSQYAISLDLAGIFAIAICLGLIRKYANTTTSITAHVAYNLLAALTLTGAVLYVAVVLEGVLVLVVGYGIWSQMRRTGAPVGP